VRRLSRHLTKGKGRRRLLSVLVFASSMALFVALLYLVIIRIGNHEEPSAMRLGPEALQTGGSGNAQT